MIIHSIRTLFHKAIKSSEMLALRADNLIKQGLLYFLRVFHLTSYQMPNTHTQYKNKHFAES